MMLDRQMSESLDRWITGRYGEDSVPDDEPQGCRTLCGRCQFPVEEVPPPWDGEEPIWRHVEGYGGEWHEATPVEPEPVQPERITCPGLGCGGEAWRMPDGVVYCAETCGLVPGGSVPTVHRQALEQPSSLVDVLLDAGEHHSVGMVRSTETYRAAERFAAGLLQTLTKGGVR